MDGKRSVDPGALSFELIRVRKRWPPRAQDRWPTGRRAAGGGAAAASTAWHPLHSTGNGTLARSGEERSGAPALRRTCLRSVFTASRTRTPGHQDPTRANLRDFLRICKGTALLK
ncbi:Homeodomain-interacting protein kinase 1 [Frankliniella fusca]|uniref:Homeodomain-interacting protein kinase 1 n=1 Tax=Frankliniella fusca TaxID=407009 RepID=A0AAE1HXD8_9NEOP|nr:Homeodomain-interacting protein kinase 1 [Frankliniella fusca]